MVVEVTSTNHAIEVFLPCSNNGWMRISGVRLETFAQRRQSDARAAGIEFESITALRKRHQGHHLQWQWGGADKRYRQSAASTAAAAVPTASTIAAEAEIEA
mmetsp:Transcript_3947/g.10119  ORF Transcript_3947/g.10119 Transcript_3947/m.10119 type:complete len:102 (+) Transcript_3947:36-341(+)